MRRGIIFLLIIFLNCFTFSAWANVTLCFVEWPPYEIIGKTPEEHDGISIDIIREAFKRAKIEVNIIERPWKRCVAMTENSEISGLIDTSKPRGDLVFLENYWVISATTIWVRDDSPVKKFTTVTQSEINPVGLVNGYTSDEKIAEDHPTMQTDFASSDATNFLKLQHGRVNSVVADLIQGYTYAIKSDPAARPLAPPYELLPLYLAFSKEDGFLKDIIDPVVAEMLMDGTINLIYKKYIDQSFDEILEATKE